MSESSELKPQQATFPKAFAELHELKERALELAYHPESVRSQLFTGNPPVPKERPEQKRASDNMSYPEAIVLIVNEIRSSILATKESIFDIEQLLG